MKTRDDGSRSSLSKRDIVVTALGLFLASGMASRYPGTPKPSDTPYIPVASNLVIVDPENKDLGCDLKRLSLLGVDVTDPDQLTSAMATALGMTLDGDPQQAFTMLVSDGRGGFSKINITPKVLGEIAASMAADMAELAKKQSAIAPSNFDKSSDRSSDGSLERF